MNRNLDTICFTLLKNLPERLKDVIERRFGLGFGKEPETLQAIGGNYGITRERVRQLEENALDQLRPGVQLAAGAAFNRFNDYFKKNGSLKKESLLLSEFGGRELKNYVFFLLSLGKDFQRFRETDDIHPFWATSASAVNSARELIAFLSVELEKKNHSLCFDEFSLPSAAGFKKEHFDSYLEISKRILRDDAGLYGLKTWPEVYPRTVRDKAYFVLRRAKKPLHFSNISLEVGKLDLFPARGNGADELPESLKQKKANVQTVHNELIKDPRFVLVGRGIYGLKEWGYEPGAVKDVLLRILGETNKPLKKEELISKVLAQRYVKRSTIFQNLQNKNYFVKGCDGRYSTRIA